MDWYEEVMLGKGRKATVLPESLVIVYGPWRFEK